MIPGSIHLNSFMYEPNVNMDNIELKNLQEQIKICNSRVKIKE
jgi:hypothetical protein